MADTNASNFKLARFNPVQKRDLDDQRHAADDRAALVAALQELRHHLIVAQPHYVYSDPIVFGGVTTGQNGAYGLANEFGSPAQYRVLQVAFGGAGQAIVGQTSSLSAPAVSDKLDPSSRIHGQVFAAAGAATIAGADAWTDIPAGGQIYAAVNVTTDSAWVTVQFRRRVSPAGVFAEGHS